VIAAVVRGTAPGELSWTLQDALEKIVAAHGYDLRTFKGETAAFAPVKPYLQACLQSERRTERRRPWAAYALITAVLALFVVFAVRQWQWRTHAANAVAALQAEPGYRILQHHTSWRQLHVAGTQDLLARPMKAVLANTDVEPDAVVAIWATAEDPRLAFERAKLLLEPPKEVTMRLKGRTLIITGTATASWSQGIARLARTIAGIRKVDMSGLRVQKGATLSQALHELETLRVRFETEESEPNAPEIARLKSALLAVDAVVAAPLRIRVEGHADPSGSPSFNQQISQRRADTVAQALAELPLQHVRLTAHGMGETIGATAENTLDPERRSVQLRVAQ
ncbi:MAG: OmpA family protein, partial [Myxococcota bacterium]